MKRSLLLFIVTSLLIGIIVTVGTSRISGLKVNVSNQYCGLILNRDTGQLTKFNQCPDNTYGYPFKYVTSGVISTVVVNQSEDSSYNVGYTSISRLRFVTDWVLWSVVAGIVVISVNSVISSTDKKTSKKKK